MKKCYIALFVLAVYSVVISFLYFRNFSDNNLVLSSEKAAENSDLLSDKAAENAEAEFSYLKSGGNSYMNVVRNYKYTRQDFFGTWEIIDAVGVDYATPSKHSGIGPDGEVRGKDCSPLISTTVKILPEHLEYQGKVYYYIDNYSPETFAISVITKSTPEERQYENVAPYYNDETLGFSESFVPYMTFCIEDEKTDANSKEYRISDFYEIYLKDSETAYIGDGIQLLLMRKTT